MPRKYALRTLSLTGFTRSNRRLDRSERPPLASVPSPNTAIPLKIRVFARLAANREKTSDVHHNRRSACLQFLSRTRRFATAGAAAGPARPGFTAGLRHEH